MNCPNCMKALSEILFTEGPRIRLPLLVAAVAAVLLWAAPARADFPV